MGTLGTCCCGCCLEEAEMPYSTVTLISPLDVCEGGLGGEGGGGIGGIGIGGGGGVGEESYPSANFVRYGCCYIAEFALACQQQNEFCGVWASQDLDFAYQENIHKLRPSFLQGSHPPEDHECTCVLVQQRNVTYHRTEKVYWLHRHKLNKILIHVGKIKTRCNGEESDVCRFYIAASYVYRVCEGVTDLTDYPAINIDYSCTGIYRDGYCSYTNSWSEDSEVQNCEDLLAALNDIDWNTVCNGGEDHVISRIKIYDTLPPLPSPTVSFTNADLPPISCCDNLSGCIVTQETCGLNLISNCQSNLPEYNGPEAVFFPECENHNGPMPPNPSNPPGLECFTSEGCPQILYKFYELELTCTGFEQYEENGCFMKVGGAIQQWPGWDIFACGYCTDDTGATTPVYTSMYNTVSAGCLGGPSPPGPLLCYTVDCCYDFGSALTYDCPDVLESTSGGVGGVGTSICKIDILNYTCTIGTIEKFTVGAVCFNLPTVTIELS